MSVKIDRLNQIKIVSGAVGTNPLRFQPRLFDRLLKLQFGLVRQLIGLLKVAGPMGWNRVDTSQFGLLLLGQLDCSSQPG
jgi:hypothetical protein